MRFNGFFVLFSIELRIDASYFNLIRWKHDIDWNNTKISILRTLAKKDGILIEKSPKTESSNRTIDIPIYLIKILKKAEINYKACKIRFGKDFVDNGYIISQENGEPHLPDSFSAKFVKLIK